MIAAVLALAAAPIISPANTISSYPTEADKALLLQASRACHLHAGAAYFVQHSPGEAAIHTTRALGDTDAQITCMLQSLPGDFIARFAVDAELAPTSKSSESSLGNHRPHIHRR